jgi:hypothetical protein
VTGDRTPARRGGATRGIAGVVLQCSLAASLLLAFAARGIPADGVFQVLTSAAASIALWAAAIVLLLIWFVSSRSAIRRPAPAETAEFVEVRYPWFFAVMVLVPAATVTPLVVAEITTDRLRNPLFSALALPLVVVAALLLFGAIAWSSSWGRVSQVRLANARRRRPHAAIIVPIAKPRGSSTALPAAATPEFGPLVIAVTDEGLEIWGRSSDAQPLVVAEWADLTAPWTFWAACRFAPFPTPVDVQTVYVGMRRGDGPMFGVHLPIATPRGLPAGPETSRAVFAALAAGRAAVRPEAATTAAPPA